MTGTSVGTPRPRTGPIQPVAFVCVRERLAEVIRVFVAASIQRRASVAFLFCLGYLGLVCVSPAGAQPAPSHLESGAAAMAPPCRLAETASLDRVVPLVSGDDIPTLILAQRAIDRDFGGAPEDPTQYALVDVPGWKSEGGAAAMSLAIPGTGQLYAGSKRGYLFIGIEAAALLSYASFKSKSDETRGEYYTYVGDPNDPNSRFSFDRLAGGISPEELARLRTVYDRDPAEFYDAVTKLDDFASGWAAPEQRNAAVTFSDEFNSQNNKQNLSFYTLIANHLVASFDALHLARFTNYTLRENMTLKLKLRPGLSHGSYAFSLTQKF